MLVFGLFCDQVNIKSFANNNEMAVMPQDRVVRLEWNRRYLSVLGVENNRLYELRLQTPENVFLEEENDLRQVMDSFRVNKVSGWCDEVHLIHSTFCYVGSLFVIALIVLPCFFFFWVCNSIKILFHCNVLVEIKGGMKR